MNSTILSNVTRSSGGGQTIFPLYIWVGTWELFCGLVGALGNGFVMHSSSTLLKEDGQDPHHHIYIFSLTVANFIFNVVHCPLMFAHYCLGLPLALGFCNILYFFTHLATVAASLSLLWINLNKFLLWKQTDITGTVPQSFLSSNRLLTFIMTAWFVSIGWAFFIIFGPMTDLKSSGTCQVHVNNPMVYIHFVLVFFLIPISSSLLISIYICWAARAETKRRTYLAAMRLEELEYSRASSISGSISYIHEPPTIAEYIEQEVMTRPPTGVGFVFLTTVWSAVTCLPYRICYIGFMIQPTPWLAKLTFGLFSLMIVNPTGVPFITILSLKEYRKKARQLLKGN